MNLYNRFIEWIVRRQLKKIGVELNDGKDE